MCVTSSHRLGSRENLLSSREIQREILEPGRALGLNRLVLGGGEPTITRGLHDTIQAALSLSYDVVLTTNLLKPGRSQMKRMLKQLDHLRHVIMVSFDSLVAEEMNLIRGGRFQHVVLAHCRLLVSLRGKMGAQTQLIACLVLQETNAGSAMETVRFLLDEVGFDRVVVQPMHRYYSVSLDNYREQAVMLRSPSSPRLSQAVEEIFAASASDGRITLIGGTPQAWELFYRDPLSIPGRCRAPEYLFIDAYGNLRGCVVGEVLSNIRLESIGDYLASERYARFLELVAVCKICIHPCS